MSEFKTDFERLLELQWKALWAWPGAIAGFWARVLSERSGFNTEMEDR